MKPPKKQNEPNLSDDNKLFLQSLRDETEAFKKLVRQINAKSQTSVKSKPPENLTSKG